MIERGVIIHPSMTWLIAYFPGDHARPADPADPASIRILRTADVTEYRALADCDPAWVAWTWAHLAQVGPGLLQAPEAVHVWELAATLALHRLSPPASTPITVPQMEAWAGRPLSSEDLDRLDEAIPHSSIPDAISEIVDALGDDDADSPDGNLPPDGAGVNAR
ncbi:MAG TPA: hypothetical protein VFG15_06980 [Amycolatopsis sp.]|nr:hypothetical protein [Amycolatopsis sp.]